MSGLWYMCGRANFKALCLAGLIRVGGRAGAWSKKRLHRCTEGGWRGALRVHGQANSEMDTARRGMGGLRASSLVLRDLPCMRNHKPLCLQYTSARQLPTAANPQFVAGFGILGSRRTEELDQGTAYAVRA